MIFKRVEELQGNRPWGRFLDAGTGWASLRWALGLDTEHLTAVTGSENRRQGLERDFSPQLRSGDRILRGNWVEDTFLKDEVFDTILVDYLVGALDRFAPYFQTRLFQRLKRHGRGRVYLVGLEPYPEPKAGETDGELLQQLTSLRDATILLAGDRPHREFPRWWVTDELRRAGFTILAEETFPIIYGREFINAELDVCRARLRDVPQPLRKTLDQYEKSLRARLLDSQPIRWGSDYLVVAEL